MEGGEVASELVLVQDDGRLEATLGTDVGIAGHGSGRLEGTVMKLDLRYGDECAGNMKFAGQAVDGGERLAGTIEVEDCTGPARGSYSFNRR